MDRAQGLRRLAIALTAAWTIAWGGIFGVNAEVAGKAHRELGKQIVCREYGECGKYGDLDEELSRKLGLGPSEVEATQAAYERQLSSKEVAATSWMRAASWWGAIGAFVIPAALFAAYWVWRGFD